jgi:hypothetical protein
MELTCEAILKGNEVEWLGETPEEVRDQKPVHVEIKLLKEPGQRSRKQEDPIAAAAALERLAAMGGMKSRETERADLSGSQTAEILERLSQLDPFKDIDDPVAWQREARTDRSLP